ncbi:MAG TPA: DUF4870 domain-containing protein [Rhodanobacteraceae bacterium]|jgi:uncharacterized Tic20 family protein|nr:DUF4870 domain-containing protein [Rhodanobacteraceae bacterium]
MSVPPESVTPPASSPSAGPGQPSTGVPSAEERQWAMFAHLSALLGGIITGWIGGWGWFLGPLIIWLVKKDTMPFVNDQAKEALNFNITVAIVFVILTILGVVTLGVGFLIALPLMVIVGIAALVFIILAAIKANEGVAYRYPFTLRLIK